MTARELIARLEADPEYVQHRADEEQRLAALAEAWRKAEQPIVKDLRESGVDVESVWDLVGRSTPYPAALPVLMKHFERAGYPDRVMNGLGRALAVKPASVYWRDLMRLYDRPGPDETVEGAAIALSGAASSDHVEDLIGLALDVPRGPNRVFFLTPILRLGGQRGYQVVFSLRDDPQIGPEARRLTTKRGKRQPPARRSSRP